MRGIQSDAVPPDLGHPRPDPRGLPRLLHLRLGLERAEDAGADERVGDDEGDHADLREDEGGDDAQRPLETLTDGASLGALVVEPRRLLPLPRGDLVVSRVHGDGATDPSQRQTIKCKCGGGGDIAPL